MTESVSPQIDTGRVHPPMNRGVGVAIPARSSNIRVVATGMLIVMAMIFVGAKYFQDAHPAVGFVRAFAEAAMVGGDRKSVVSGKSVSVRVDLGGRRIIKKKKSNRTTKSDTTRL